MEIEVMGVGRIISDNLDGEWYVDECEHDVEFEDFETKGVCRYCGEICDFCMEKDIYDNYPDVVEEVEVPVPINWRKGVEEGLLWDVTRAYDAGEIQEGDVEFKGHKLTIRTF